MSLILLEAMNQGKPMLVNGHCKVLKEHCFKSDWAAFYYMSQRDFNQKLHQLESSAELRSQMGNKGMAYVQKNYNWNLIMTRLKQAINRI